MKMKDWSREKREKRENEILKLMGLEKFAESYPSQLSVSTEQRMVIGRAFAMNPDLLLMDEPYGQMDIKMRFYLEDEVIRLWKETGTTVIFITHNIEAVSYTYLDVYKRQAVCYVCLCQFIRPCHGRAKTFHNLI